MKTTTKDDNQKFMNSNQKKFIWVSLNYSQKNLKKKSKFLDFGTKSYNSISQNTKKTSKTHVKTQQISK